MEGSKKMVIFLLIKWKYDTGDQFVFCNIDGISTDLINIIPNQMVN